MPQKDPVIMTYDHAQDIISLAMSALNMYVELGMVMSAHLREKAGDEGVHAFIRKQMEGP